MKPNFPGNYIFRLFPITEKERKIGRRVYVASRNFTSHSCSDAATASKRTQTYLFPGLFVPNLWVFYDGRQIQPHEILWLRDICRCNIIGTSSANISLHDANDVGQGPSNKIGFQTSAGTSLSHVALFLW